MIKRRCYYCGNEQNVNVESILHMNGPFVVSSCKNVCEECMNFFSRCEACCQIIYLHNTRKMVFEEKMNNK